MYAPSVWGKNATSFKFTLVLIVKKYNISTLNKSLSVNTHQLLKDKTILSYDLLEPLVLCFQIILITADGWIDNQMISGVIFPPN